MKGQKEIVNKSYYPIPLGEKATIYAMRIFILGGLVLRLKLRRIVPYRYSSLTEVFQYYFPRYELPYIRKKIDITAGDTISAIKIVTYFHTLTGVTGKIVEMTPNRSVREEYSCPLQSKVSREFCSSVMSLPVFTKLCGELNEKIEHQHTSFLSGGDRVCRLAFELEGE